MNARLVPRRVTVDSEQSGVGVEYGVFVDSERFTGFIAEGRTLFDTPEVVSAAQALLVAVQTALARTVGDEEKGSGGEDDDDAPHRGIDNKEL